MAFPPNEVPKREFERRVPFYELWQKREGIPVYKVFHVDDLNAVELAPWRRFGGRGAFINLADADITAAMVLEIPPAETLLPARHTFETWVFVIAGEGETVFEQPGRSQQTLRWRARSLFGPPLNVAYRHRNLSARAPARLLMVANAPLIFNLYHNEKFVLDHPFDFEDRYAGQEGFFFSEPQHLGGRVARVNFIPDAREFGLIEWRARGRGAKSLHLSMSGHTMAAHLSEFDVGTYKKGHRHGPGAHVIVLSGHGYSLLWEEGKERIRVNWKEGSMFAPAAGWYHQHFNTGAEPARYLALRRGGSPEHPLKISTRGTEQIEYEDEDPAIYDLFEEELREQGIPIRQPKLSRAG